ncbi:hypothetical protein J2W35_005411 [Variovorax boronicumulans]|nr:hypothetical protein [Variovorax boronicumulans]
MKTPNIIAAAVLLLLAASGAQAQGAQQGFEPVQPLRAEVV